MAPDSPNTDLLLDFLYVDRDRLQTYAAQLFNAGVLSSTKTVDQTASLTTGQVGIPGTNIGGGNSSYTSQEQLFDAFHTLPLNVLDRLDEFGWIAHDVSNAGLGDLFLAEGRIRFLDFKLIQNCWDPIQAAVLAEQQAQGKHMKQNARAAVSNNFNILKALPHSTELTLYTAQEHIWTCINPAHLRVDPATLAFSFGSALSGRWHMLATLDARPDSADEILQAMAEMPMGREMQIGMSQAMDGIRMMLGRPYTSYGATPILIFRYTKKPASVAPVPTGAD